MIDRLLGILLTQAFEEWMGKKIDTILAALNLLGRSQKRTENKLESLEKIMSALADKIRALIAVETEEGKKLQDANIQLTASLASANEKIVALEALAASVPELSAQLEGLKADLAAADEAASEIANINPTPVSDGIVEEVIENPEIPTPPVVEEAPAPTPEVIPDVPVVEAAIDALDEVEG
jgi:chromosome segregation ATPase